jgi:glycosyltransferase involved in cell wall biosynthesis
MIFAGLRIGLVGPLPPPAGGMANQTRQLAELLSAAKAAVFVVQSNAPYRPAFSGQLMFLRALFRLVPYLLALWRVAGRVDVVHIMANSGWSWHLVAMPAIWIARIRNVPVVVNYRGGEAKEFLASSHSIVRRSMKVVSMLVVPSRFLQEVFSSFGMSAKIVPNIIDLSRFHPCEATKSNTVHLVVARNLEPLYDNETALRAFRIVLNHCQNSRLTIAGTGPEEKRLRDLTVQLGVENLVTFTGRLDRDAMADLYRQADIMINPSLADNMPNSVLESMASGIPVVSTNVGGIPFILQDGVTALLVEPGNAIAMAAATLKLIQDPALWHRLSIAGVEEVERYTWERVAPVLAEVYRTVINEAAH